MRALLVYWQHLARCVLLTTDSHLWHCGRDGAIHAPSWRCCAGVDARRRGTTRRYAIRLLSCQQRAATRASHTTLRTRGGSSGVAIAAVLPRADSTKAAGGAPYRVHCSRRPGRISRVASIKQLLCGARLFWHRPPGLNVAANRVTCRSILHLRAQRVTRAARSLYRSGRHGAFMARRLTSYAMYIFIKKTAVYIYHLLINIASNKLENKHVPSLL